MALALLSHLAALRSKLQADIDQHLFLYLLLAVLSPSPNTLFYLDAEQVHVPLAVRQIQWMCASMFGLTSHAVALDHETSTDNFLRSMLVTQPFPYLARTPSTSRSMTSMSAESTIKPPSSPAASNTPSHSSLETARPPSCTPPPSPHQPSSSKIAPSLTLTPTRSRKTHNFKHYTSTNPVGFPSDIQSTPSIPQVIVLTGLHNASYAIQRAFLKMLRTKKVEISPLSSSTSSSPLPLDDTDEMEGVFRLPDDFIVVSIIPRDKKRRKVDPANYAINLQVLDRFGQSYYINVDPMKDHPRRPRPMDTVELCLGSIYKELDALRKLAQDAFVHPRLKIYICDLISAFRHHPRLNPHSLTARCDASTIARWASIWAIVSSDYWQTHPPPLFGEEHEYTEDEMEQDERVESFISVVKTMSVEVRPHHVKQILPSILRHRLSFRNYPELSTFWGSDPRALAKRHEQNSSMETVIQQVLDMM